MTHVVKRWAFLPMLLVLCSAAPSILAPHASLAAKWLIFAVAVPGVGYVCRRRQRTWPRAGR